MASTWSDKLEISHFKKFETSRNVFGNPVVRGTLFEEKSEDIEKKDAIMSLKEQKSNSEKAAIISALEHCGNNKAKTARMLNISRTLLYKKLERYNIMC
jgi:DNA-binding NtrC family response regulator